MAYTIPEYVDTPEQAILAVASAVKGEQVTGGDGNVGTALDILADALAGEDVEVPMTQQGAILALAQYVSGGGGGGVDLGPLGYVSSEGSAVPTVGNMPDFGSIVAVAKIGDTTIFDEGAYPAATNLAAGLTLTTTAIPAEYVDTIDAYVCTVDWTGSGYTSVEPWDGTLTRTSATTTSGVAGYAWTFTMPELQYGEFLVLWPYLAD